VGVGSGDVVGLDRSGSDVQAWQVARRLELLRRNADDKQIESD
jgi:hypothetical protein